MDQYKLREQITKEYDMSLLDGGIQSYLQSSIKQRQIYYKNSTEIESLKSWSNYIHTKLFNIFNNIINIRSTQPLVDVVLRNARAISTICMPHLRQDFFLKHSSSLHSQSFSLQELSTKKWNILQKGSLSLDDSLLYLMLRCLMYPLQNIKNKTIKTMGGLFNNHYSSKKIYRRSQSYSSSLFKGALLPIHVKTTSSSDSTHANMIFIYFNISDNQRSASPICYLFDPNGTSFIKKHHPSTISHLQKSWDYVYKQFQYHFPFVKINKTIRVIGGEGIQTLLGIKEVQTTRTLTGYKKTIKKQGFPICGSITYWIFIKWLLSHDENYEDFEKNFIKTIYNSKSQYQLEVLDFIKKIRKQMEESYKINVTNSIMKDSKLIQKYINILKRKKYSHVTHQLNYSVEIRLEHPLNNKINAKIPISLQI